LNLSLHVLLCVSYTCYKATTLVFLQLCKQRNTTTNQNADVEIWRPKGCQLELGPSHPDIAYSIPCLHSFECQHSSGISQNSALTTAQSTHHHSQKILFLSLPETDDFDRIFPGPILTAQTSHQSPTEMHQPDDSSTPEPILPVEESSESSQLVPNGTSENLTQFEECQLSSISW